MKYSEVEVLDFVEGKLDDKQTAEFLEKQRSDPELAAAVRAMRASQLPIAKAYQQQPLPSVPESLKRRLSLLAPDIASTGSEDKRLKSNTRIESTQSQSLSVETSRIDVKKRGGLLVPIGLVACLASGIGMGALITQQYLQNGDASTVGIEKPAELLPGELDHDRLVKRIADYQSLYVEKTVATLSESRIDDAAQLLKSIGSQTNGGESIPDFTSFGYEFARAQPLGFEGKTLIQLVYRKPGSAPLALCLMPDSAAKNLPMKLSEHHGLNAAGWVDLNQHYVVVTDESTIVLEQIYKAVFQTFRSASG